MPALTEALLVTAGAVAAHGSGSPWAAFAAAVAGSAVGMTISFHVGRAAQPALHRWTARVSDRAHARGATRAQEWWRRPACHATAIVAGSMNMDRRRFVALAVCGACAWSSLLLWSGGVVGARTGAVASAARPATEIIVEDR